MSQAFISWSGEFARGKARALRKLLDDVLPEASVFMSDEDISAGSLWLTSISGSLDKSVAGVIMVTPDNLKNPWVHYEAGALATRVETRMVIPLLSGLTPSDLAATPLSIFQARVLDKAAIQEVCTSFASALGSTRPRESIVRAFDKWWDDYADELLAAPVSPVSLTKPPKSIDDLVQLTAQIQSQLRAQTELLNALLAANSPSQYDALSSASQQRAMSGGILSKYATDIATFASGQSNILSRIGGDTFEAHRAASSSNAANAASASASAAAAAAAAADAINRSDRNIVRTAEDFAKRNRLPPKSNT